MQITNEYAQENRQSYPYVSEHNQFKSTINSSTQMKITPLDKGKKYILQCFLKLVPNLPGTTALYTSLYIMLKKNDIFKKDAVGKLSKAINRLFIDIYKRICIKHSKKNPQDIFFSKDMEQKVAYVIRYYQQLYTKEIFIKLCYRYNGNKELGQVTEQQEVQFYEEVNLKVNTLCQKKDSEKKVVVDYENESIGETEDRQKGKLVLFANGIYQNRLQQKNNEQEQKPDKSWEQQVQNQQKKIENPPKNIKRQKLQEKKEEKQKNKNIKQEKPKAKTEEKDKNNNGKNQQSNKQAQVKELKSQQTLIKLQLKNQNQSYEESQQQADAIPQKPTKSKDLIRKMNDRIIQQKYKAKMKKRKIVKPIGPLENKPIQLKPNSQIWTPQLQLSLCQQYLSQQESLANLAQQFSSKQKITPILTTKQILQKLIKIMTKSFSIYLQMHEQKSTQKLPISQISSYDPIDIERLLETSHATSLRKKLIQFYIKQKDPNYQIKDKQAYQIYLHVKQGITALKFKQNSCSQETLTQLLKEKYETENQTEQYQRGTRPKTRRPKPNLNRPLLGPKERLTFTREDQEELAVLKSGKNGRKVFK